MDKIKYLEEKIEFYRQEVERYKSMILYEKKDFQRKEFLTEELEAAEEMFEMFVAINTQVLAWDSLKKLVQVNSNNSFAIDALFELDSIETASDYMNIFNALQYDPEFNVVEFLEDK